MGNKCCQHIDYYWPWLNLSLVWKHRTTHCESLWIKPIAHPQCVNIFHSSCLLWLSCLGKLLFLTSFCTSLLMDYDIIDKGSCTEAAIHRKPQPPILYCNSPTYTIFHIVTRTLTQSLFVMVKVHHQYFMNCNICSSLMSVVQISCSKQNVSGVCFAGPLSISCDHRMKVFASMGNDATYRQVFSWFADTPLL